MLHLYSDDTTNVDESAGRCIHCDDIVVMVAKKNLCPSQKFNIIINVSLTAT
jgi:hypothetical protein